MQWIPNASTEDGIKQLHKLYPETAAAKVLHERVLRRSDCPLFTPGTYTRRPTVVTPQPGLALAGDGIRVDLPVALMERAATTGCCGRQSPAVPVGCCRPRVVHRSRPRTIGVTAVAGGPPKA